MRPPDDESFLQSPRLSVQESVRAEISISTGTPKWAFKTASNVASSLAVINGAAYFLSYDGNFALYALI
jgi:hypothetical protein